MTAAADSLKAAREALFDGRAEYMKRRFDAKYPSNCRMDHPPIGYFPNDWRNDERCPVCLLLDALDAADADRAKAVAQHAREIADANAAILRLQARLDSVRDVVRAAVAQAEWFERGGASNAWRKCTEATEAAVDALPADAREWASE